MDFEIRFQGLENADPLREHAELLVLAHLGRFRAELTRVSIVLGRRNGAMRPPEVRCEITATGPRLPAPRSTTVDRAPSPLSRWPSSEPRAPSATTCGGCGPGAWTDPSLSAPGPGAMPCAPGARSGDLPTTGPSSG